jgi:hypothetical protein
VYKASSFKLGRNSSVTKRSMNKTGQTAAELAAARIAGARVKWQKRKIVEWIFAMLGSGC